VGGTPEKVAVLMLAYGGPDSLDEVEPFLRRIMAPREPSEETIARATERYRAISGRSPLVGNTLLQARLLQERLDAAGVALGLGGRGVSFHVVPGMRHTAPSIHDAVRRAVTGSDGTIVALIMASHQSERATGAYLREVSASFEGLSAEEGSGAAAPLWVDTWHTSALFVEAVAERVREALARLDSGPKAVTAAGDANPAGVGADDADRADAASVIDDANHAAAADDDTAVLFTAHSLPLVNGEGDPEYERALLATAEGVMSLVGDRPWRLAYQSASAARGGRWLGPRVEDSLRELATVGLRKVVVAPLGFVSEHLETLYDLDIDLAGEALEAGVVMTRAATVHDSPKFIEALAEAVVACVRGRGVQRGKGRPVKVRA